MSLRAHPSIHPPPRDRAALALWGASGLFVAAFAAWLWVGGAGPNGDLWTNGLTLIGPVGATLVCAAGIWRAAPGRARRAGLVLILAAAADSIGQGIFSYHAIVNGIECPFPSLADAFYLIFYGLLLVGLLMLPWRRMPAAVRGRAILDAATSTVALAAFSWHYAIVPTLADASNTPLALTIGLAYPLLDLVICFLALLLLSQARRQPVPGTTVGALIVAAIVLAVGDVVFFLQTAAQTYVAGQMVDLTWPVANMLVALAAWHLCRRPRAAEAERADDVDAERASRATAFLPYGLLPPTIWLAVGNAASGRWDAATIGACVGAAVLVGLILARQCVVLIENDRLYGRLRRAFGELAAHHDAANFANDMLAVANARLAEANEKLSHANDQLVALATTDGMTGLANHREFQERLREAVVRSRRGSGPVALLLIDVDHFKQLNDAHGHPAGDAVLRALANVLRATVRGGDLPARYGGEEFAVVCCNATSTSIVALAERIRAAVARHPFGVRAVTVSIGVSGTDVAGLDAGRLIETADRALYASKRAGRDRVTVATVEGGGGAVAA